MALESAQLWFCEAIVSVILLWFPQDSPCVWCGYVYTRTSNCFM